MEHDAADGTSLNIALVPDEAVGQAAISASEALGRRVGAEFTLASDELIPHITLYQTQFPTDRLRLVYEAVATVVAKTPAFEVRLRNVEVYKWTFLFWRCELSDELAVLHQRIVGATNDLRAGMVLPMLSAVRPFLDQTEQSDVENYGAVWIGPNYQPHITLSRVKDVQEAGTALEIAEQLASRAFVPTGVVVGESREHGTIGRILRRFAF